MSVDQADWEREQDDQERRRDLEERTAEAIDGLYRALRDCLAVEIDDGFSVGLALVDGLLMAEHEAHRPWRQFPFERLETINIQFLLESAERFLADIRTAVMLLRSTGPGPGGRRHGVHPEGGERCVCGWVSMAVDLTPLSQHLRAVIELGGER